MKHFLYTLVIMTLIASSLSSCEDVVSVELPNDTPKLVIDAIVRIDTTKSNTMVVVKVFKTSVFFENNTPAIPDLVTLTNLNTSIPQESSLLEETEEGSGIFTSSISTKALMQGQWQLQINYNNQIFTATSQYVPSVPIESITFGDGFLFDEDDIEVIISIIDEPNRNDFYLFDFDFNNFLVTDDEFYQGQPFSFSYFYDNDDSLVPGDQIDISILGIDEPFSNFMEKVIDQSDGSFNPFETPSITIRGNIVNTTNLENNENAMSQPDNFALGYFALVQEFKETIVIK